MSVSTTPMMSSSSVYIAPAFWERLWRTAGIQSALCFIVGYIAYGSQPQVGASPDALTAFYGGSGARILIAAVFYGVAVLNLMWFSAAIRTTLADAGYDGWGAAATACSSASEGCSLCLWPWWPPSRTRSLAAEMFAVDGAFQMPYFDSLGVPSRYQGYEQVRAAKSHRPATAKVSRKS